MKRLFEKLFLLSAVTSMLVMVSCSDDEDTTPAVAQPSISVVLQVNGQSATTAQPGDSISFVISAQAEGGINRIYTTAQSFVGFDQNRNDLGLASGDTNVSKNLVLAGSPESTDVGSTWTATFIVVDEVDQADSTTVTVDIVSPDAKVQTAKLLYAPTGDGNSLTFYAIAENVIYAHTDVTGTAEAVSPKIDLGYYYGGSTDLASLAPISAYPSSVFDISGWGTKNATKLVKTTMAVETYTSLVSVADVEVELEGLDFTTQNGIQTNLAVGNVLAFETVDGLQGFIYVSGLEPGFDSNDYIELEFILATSAE